MGKSFPSRDRAFIFISSHVTQHRAHMPHAKKKTSKKEAAQSAGLSDTHPVQVAVSSTAAKSACSDNKRPDKQKSDRASPKNETASHTFSNDSHLVPPKGCSTAVLNAPWQCRQTAFLVGVAHDVNDDDGGHPDVSPRSVAAVVRHPTELQRLQRRIRRTLDQIRDPSLQLPSRMSTAVLEQRRDGIQAIALDERPQPELQRGFEYLPPQRSVQNPGTAPVRIDIGQICCVPDAFFIIILVKLWREKRCSTHRNWSKQLFNRS